MADKDESSGSSITWAPVAAGAGYGAYNIYKGGSAMINPKGWFTRPSNAIAYKNAMVSAGYAGATSDFYTQGINRMATSMSYMRGGPNSVIKAQINEAMRASLWRGMALSPQDIERYSRGLYGAGFTGGSTEAAAAFDLARNVVGQYGDPKVFYQRMKSFGQGAPTGELLDPNILAGMRRQYGVSEEYMAHMAPDTLFEASKITKAIPAEWGASMSYYEFGGQTPTYMGRLRLTHPGLPSAVRLNIPLTEGIYRSGQHMESSYMTQNILVGGRKMTFGEFQMGRITGRGGLLERLLAEPNPTKESIKRTVMEFNQKMSAYMVYTPSLKTPGQEIIDMIQSNIVIAPEMAGSQIQDLEMAGLYKTGMYYPTGTPKTISKAKVFANFDPRSVYANPEVYPIERRPLQGIRPYSPTTGAAKLMRSQFGPGGAFRRDIPFLATNWWKENVVGRGQVSPQLMMAYAVPGGRLESTLKGSQLAAEEILIRQKLMPLFNTWSTREEIISGAEYMSPKLRRRLNQIGKGSFGSAIPLAAGERIGYGLGSGLEISAAKAAGLTEQIVGAEPFNYAGGTALKLQIQQTHMPGWYVKLFGMTKATTRAREDAVIQKVAADAGVPNIGRFVDGFAYADELRKNQSFLRMQMQSALAWTAADAMQAGKVSSKYIPEINMFLEEGWNWAGDFSRTEADVLRMAKRWGLPLGPIGGMLPKILPKSEYGAILRNASKMGISAKALHKELSSAQYVLGLSTSAVGGFRYTGGGGSRATFEPRGFMQLYAHGDPASRALAGEIARSMKGYGQEMGDIQRTIASMAGQTIEAPDYKLADISLGQTAEDISISAGTGYLKKQGYMLDVGRPIEAFGGASKIYVPGFKSVRGLDLYRLSGGETAAESLSQSFYHFVRTAKHMKDTTAGAAALEKSAKKLSDSILESMSHAMAGVSEGGMQGALRGRMAGSAFLAPSTIDTRYSEAAPGTIEISRAAAKDMFKDLLASAQTEKEIEFIKKQMHEFLVGQQAMPVGLGRHGLIGPYSMQAAWARVAEGAESAEEYFIRTSRPIEETVRLGSKVAGISEFKADISPLLGLAMDHDDDRAIVKLIGTKKADAELRNALRTGGYTQKYRQFAAESSLIREVIKQRNAANAADIIEQTDIDRLITGSSKLRLGVGWELGQLSNALSELKMSMATQKPAGAYKFNVLAEILEQQVISGKHMKSISDNIAAEMINGLRNADVGSLVESTRRLMGTELEKDISMSMAGQSWTMAGINPEKMWTEAINARQQFRQSVEGKLYSQMIKGARGQFEIDIKQMNAMLNMAKTGKTDFLTATAMREISTVEGTGSRMARNAMGALNKAKTELGSVARSFGKPFLYGLAGSAALSMLMGGPSPKPMIPPAEGAGASRETEANRAYAQRVSGGMTRPIQSTGRDLRPENFPLPQSVNGNPSIPGMSSPETYMTTSPAMNMRTGRRYMINAQTGFSGAPDQESMYNVFGKLTPGATVDIRYSDNRSKLTAQNIGDIRERY